MTPTCRSGASSPTQPAVRYWTSAREPAACPWIWPHRAMTWWRSTATRSCSRSSPSASRRVRTVHADAREFSVDDRVPAGHRTHVARANPRRAPRQGRHASEACTRTSPLKASSPPPISDPSDAVPEELIPPPLPDILERDGWVFSSQPLTMYEQDGCVVIERRRQAVSPTRRDPGGGRADRGGRGRPGSVRG